MSGSFVQDLVTTPSTAAETLATETRDYAEKGTRCERDEENSDATCFLEQVTRDRYKDVIREAVSDMKESYKDALTQLRVDELIKDEDDLNWAVSLVLDIAGAHLLGLAVKGLSRARLKGLDKVSGKILDTRLSGGKARGIHRHAVDALSAIGEDTIESWTKPAFDMGKSAAQSAAKSVANSDDATQKAVIVSYIDELTTGAEIGFGTFRNRASSGDDLQLMIMNEALINAPKDIGTFKDLLAKKLHGFRTSGIQNIGRKDARDNSISPSQPIVRDTRVVWVVGPDGEKRLFYQSQDGDLAPSIVHHGDPGTAWLPGANQPKKFGPRNPRGAPTTGREVPEEFAQNAIDVHKQRWGEAPHTIDPWERYKSPAAGLNDYMFGSDEDEMQPPPALIYSAHDGRDLLRK